MEQPSQLDGSTHGRTYRQWHSVPYRQSWETYTATITEHDRPHHVTFLVAGKTMDITGELKFADLGGSTRLTGTFDLRPKGFRKVMLPLMAGAVQKDFPRQMASFKKCCES